MRFAHMQPEALKVKQREELLEIHSYREGMAPPSLAPGPFPPLNPK